MPHVTRPKMPAETAGIGVVPRVSSSLCENNHAEAGFFAGKARNTNAAAGCGSAKHGAVGFPNKRLGKQALSREGNIEIKEGRKQ